MLMLLILSSVIAVPTFNCVLKSDFSTNDGVVTYTTCSPTTSGMGATSGVFTVATAGVYRLTFMARMKGNNLKIVAEMKLNDATEIGRSVAVVRRKSTTGFRCSISKYGINKFDLNSKCCNRKLMILTY